MHVKSHHKKCELLFLFMYRDLSQKTLTLTSLPSHDVHSLLCLKDDVLSTLGSQNRWSLPTSGCNNKKFNYQTRQTDFVFYFQIPILKEHKEWKSVSENTFSSRLTVSRIQRTMPSKNTMPASSPVSPFRGLPSQSGRGLHSPEGLLEECLPKGSPMCLRFH